jgi:excinuclease UvrABC nuclease subunit
MENNAFNKPFINKISKSNKLDEISSDEEINKYLPTTFNNIQHMQDFYDSLLDEIKQISTNKSKKQLESELNEKLDSYIKLEKFEEAAKLRDYMSKNSIKRKNNNL